MRPILPLALLELSGEMPETPAKPPKLADSQDGFPTLSAKIETLKYFADHKERIEDAQIRRRNGGHTCTSPF